MRQQRTVRRRTRHRSMAAGVVLLGIGIAPESLRHYTERLGQLRRARRVVHQLRGRHFDQQPVDRDHRRELASVLLRQRLQQHVPVVIRGEPLVVGGRRCQPQQRRRDPIRTRRPPARRSPATRRRAPAPARAPRHPRRRRRPHHDDHDTAAVRGLHAQHERHHPDDDDHTATMPGLHAQHERHHADEHDRTPVRRRRQSNDEPTTTSTTVGRSGSRPARSISRPVRRRRRRIRSAALCRPPAMMAGRSTLRSSP